MLNNGISVNVENNCQIENYFCNIFENRANL